jgi:hypothetical protein
VRYGAAGYNSAVPSINATTTQQRRRLPRRVASSAGDAPEVYNHHALRRVRDASESPRVPQAGCCRGGGRRVADDSGFAERRDAHAARRR